MDLAVDSGSESIKITEYDVSVAFFTPTGITTGPDGALWSTETSGPGKIGRITTTGTVSGYSVPTTPSYPTITACSDGALWFAEFFGNKIGRVTTAGSIAEYPIPTSSGGPNGITAGSDGALWFTELFAGNKIGGELLRNRRHHGVPRSNARKQALFNFGGTRRCALVHRKRHRQDRTGYHRWHHQRIYPPDAQ